MYRHKFTAVGLMSLLIGLATTVNAGEGIYLAANIGSAKVDENIDGLNVDDTSFAYRLTAGWRLNKSFALEAAYQDFGDLKTNVQIGNVLSTLRFSANGFALGAVGALPLGEKVSVYGRTGMFFWNGKASINSVGQSSPDDINPYFGAGLAYSITDSFSITGDWTYYDMEDIDSGVIAFGLQYRLGR